MNLTKSDVVELLRKVKDPLAGLSIVDAHRIREIEIEGKRIRIVLVFTQNLTQEQKSSVNFGCMSAIQENVPDTDVHVHLETQLRTGETDPGILPQVKNIIAVASGKGGVGKSTVSSNLAVGLKKLGYRTGLIDADFYGPSIPTMFGLEGQRPKLVDVHGKPKIVPLEAQGLSIISIGFIVEPDQAVVLRGPRLAGIMKQFIEECTWPELDYLVIDLPPGTGDIQLTLVQTVPLTGVVLVTTPQKVAWMDAVKAMNMFRLASVNVPILGVLENMAWFTPPELPDRKYYLFGKGGGKHLAELAGSKVLGQIPIVESIRESGDMGSPIVTNENSELNAAWMEFASNTVEAVELRNKTMDPTKVVDVK
ncbi:MAG: Mrp/NBP35 family ATP-binding protein [Saprospiraceae bacterium]|nr:Mrp/NBP35 family ATP-binding protein [Saprospiraceae bacterium]